METKKDYDKKEWMRRMKDDEKTISKCHTA
jgi:hypothetical protein